MEQIGLDEATTHLSEIVERMRQTGRPVTLTRHGEPYADLVPHRPATARQTWAEIMAEVEDLQRDLPTTGFEQIRADIAEGRR